MTIPSEIEPQKTSGLPTQILLSNQPVPVCWDGEGNGLVVVITDRKDCSGMSCDPQDPAIQAIVAAGIKSLSVYAGPETGQDYCGELDLESGCIGVPRIREELGQE